MVLNFAGEIFLKYAVKCTALVTEVSASLDHVLCRRLCSETFSYGQFKQQLKTFLFWS